MGAGNAIPFGVIDYELFYLDYDIIYDYYELEYDDYDMFHLCFDFLKKVCGKTYEKNGIVFGI